MRAAGKPEQMEAVHEERVGAFGRVDYVITQRGLS